MHRVVVTGVGALTPLGSDVKSMWKAMLEGRNGIAPISRFDTSDYKAKLAGEIKNYDPEKYFERMEARKLDLYTQYGLIAAAEAMADSGLVAISDGVVGNIKAERLGVYVGSGVGGLNTMTSAQDTLREKGPARVSAATVPMMISNIAAAHLAIKYKAKGVNVPIVTACATGANSIGEAFLAIRGGAADAIITGGAEACVNQLAIAAFSNMLAMSVSTDPNAASLPFDKRRGGFVLGEGAGMLVLEEYEHAKARKAKIYCEIVGYGNTCDAFHITAPEANADGYIRALKAAAEMADLAEDEKIYYNAHGTGTDLNDKAETLAIKTVFAKKAKLIPISSTKSMTGHMLGATGAVEALVCVKALETDSIPPTINLKQSDPECDLDYVPNKMRKYNADVAISANSGFGGHNAVLIFRRIKNA